MERVDFPPPTPSRPIKSSLDPPAFVPLVSELKSLPRKYLPPTRRDDGAQYRLFYRLALNRQYPIGHGVLAAAEREESVVRRLDRDLVNETTFLTCRALRRLLLGLRFCPTLPSDEDSADFYLRGPEFHGPGLIIHSSSITVRPITTEFYLPVFKSMEITDYRLGAPVPPNRGLVCPEIAHVLPDYPTLFGIVMRYITLSEFESCFNEFGCLLTDKTQSIQCRRNYFQLLYHLKPQVPLINNPSHALEFLKFNISHFLRDHFANPRLEKLVATVSRACQERPEYLLALYQLAPSDELEAPGWPLVSAQKLVNSVCPDLKLEIGKRDARGGDSLYRVKLVFKDHSFTRWIDYPKKYPLYRIVMFLSVTDPETCEGEGAPPPPPRRFARDETTPLSSRSRYAATVLQLTRLATRCPLPVSSHQSVMRRLRTTPAADGATENDSATGGRSLFEMHAISKHISISGFKLTVFNTNMVINSKIFCARAQPPPLTLLDIGKLTSNFVVRKYSVKEPSFTVSLFYSNDMTTGAAININISGDLLNFITAMNSLKCFIPITHIGAANFSNWNFTYDLQGLENQNVVRTGRRDLFWTTNFPSAISSKRGYNISWFKAATATISKIYGRRLSEQVREEVVSVIRNPTSKINRMKNLLFVTLEKRNVSQIQTLQKRFLESLFECVSVQGLDTRCIYKLTTRGVFDFSKKIITHSKNKHECALIGYRKCNSIPKIMSHNKKIRLDEFGRNANSLTWLTQNRKNYSRIKERLLRHIEKRLGLSPACQLKPNTATVRRALAGETVSGFLGRNPVARRDPGFIKQLR